MRRVGFTGSRVSRARVERSRMRPMPRGPIGERADRHAGAQLASTRQVKSARLELDRSGRPSFWRNAAVVTSMWL